jgi:hypothetical protein
MKKAKVEPEPRPITESGGTWSRAANAAAFFSASTIIAVLFPKNLAETVA